MAPIEETKSVTSIKMEVNSGLSRKIVPNKNPQFEQSSDSLSGSGKVLIPIDYDEDDGTKAKAVYIQDDNVDLDEDGHKTARDSLCKAASSSSLTDLSQSQQIAKVALAASRAHEIAAKMNAKASENKVILSDEEKIKERQKKIIDSIPSEKYVYLCNALIPLLLVLTFSYLPLLHLSFIFYLSLQRCSIQLSSGLGES